MTDDNINNHRKDDHGRCREAEKWQLGCQEKANAYRLKWQRSSWRWISSSQSWSGRWQQKDPTRVKSHAKLQTIRPPNTNRREECIHLPFQSHHMPITCFAHEGRRNKAKSTDHYYHRLNVNRSKNRGFGTLQAVSTNQNCQICYEFSKKGKKPKRLLAKPIISGLWVLLMHSATIRMHFVCATS